MRTVHSGLFGRTSQWAALGLVGLVAAACGTAGSPTPSSTVTATSTPRPSAAQATSASAAPSPSTSAAASKGPATATVSLTGSNGLTGPVTTTEIICGQPALAGGPQIFVLGRSGSTGPQVVLFIQVGHVEVRVGTGSGATLSLRTFAGTGVTGFDAASGAQIDSPLTETTAAGSATGSLGALASISGTIDCGDQQQGTSTVVVSGVSPYGQLDGVLGSTKVTCTITSGGTYVGVNGLSSAGATPVLVFVTASAGALQVAVETTSSGSFYSGKGAAITTLVPGGATMAGDVTESVKAGATPHVLHVAGDATCGTTVHP
jgi:hypothetical protein